MRERRRWRVVVLREERRRMGLGGWFDWFAWVPFFFSPRSILCVCVYHFLADDGLSWLGGLDCEIIKVGITKLTVDAQH